MHIAMLASFGPPGPPTSPQVLTYVSDGDANGVLYFLGRGYGTAAWTNPETANFVDIISKPVGGAGNVNTLCDRAASEYSSGGSDGAGNEWFKIDFGAVNTMLASKFSYRYRNDSSNFSPTAWKWEGSNDDSAWDELADVTGQTPSASTWVSTDAAVQTTAYRYIRVRQIGNNNNGTSHFSIGELEVYGTFTF